MGFEFGWNGKWNGVLSNVRLYFWRR